MKNSFFKLILVAEQTDHNHKIRELLHNINFECFDSKYLSHFIVNAKNGTKKTVYPNELPEIIEVENIGRIINNLQIEMNPSNPLIEIVLDLEVVQEELQLISNKLFAW